MLFIILIEQGQGQVSILGYPSFLIQCICGPIHLNMLFIVLLEQGLGLVSILSYPSFLIQFICGPIHLNVIYSISRARTRTVFDIKSSKFSDSVYLWSYSLECYL